MTYTDMTNEQLLELMAKSIIEANEEFDGHMEITRRIFNKKMTGAQFNAAQRKAFEQVLPLMLDAFKKGYYFSCQGLDFLSCLMLTKEEVERDQRRWSNLMGAATTIGRDMQPDMAEVKEFAATRVDPPHASRRMFLTATNELKADMGEGVRKSFERYRDTFQAATKKWSWRQPFDPK